MKVEWKTSFTKRFRKLPQPLRERCKDRLKIFELERSHILLNDRPLHGAWVGCRSINVTGDYRAIYVEVADIVWFIRIGTHHELFGT